MVAFVKLVAEDKDGMGYITYVFKCLEDNMIKKTPYIMCVRYPNWEQKPISIGDCGYLSFVEIRAGIDKWYDGQNMIPYNYNNIQFIKFIKREKELENHEYVM